MKSRTKRKNEANRLRSTKPGLDRFNVFGDDHHAAIDAQCQVLEEALPVEEIGRLWSGQTYIRDAALHAHHWMLCQVDDDKDRPSDGWGLVKRLQARGHGA